VGNAGIISGSLPRPFGKYTLTRELGRGAMGAVFEARDSALDRRVALKLMLPSDNPNPQDAAVEEQLFTREAQLLGRLEKHPNIVSVYEAGSIEGRRYIAMEYIDGIPLSEWTKQRKPTLRARVRILRDVAYAVHHAHRGGILHRDLKPMNVLIDARGRPYVTDFGMGKRVGATGESSSGASSSSSAGTVVGTPSYMSPEQAQGLRKVDARTDVYALGAMLYEILTGNPPFPGEMTIIALMQVVQDPVKPPSEASPDWARSTEDKSIEAVCMQALSKNPDDRFPDAITLADRLSLWLGDKPAPQPAAQKGRGLLPYVLPAVALPIVMVLALILTRMNQQQPPASELMWAQAPPLLTLVDPAKDAVAGSWKSEKGSLVAAASSRARIGIPLRPPEEYDLKVTFVRREGAEDVAVLLPWNGTTLVWTTPRGLENGTPHTAVFRVRKDGLASSLTARRVNSLTSYANPPPPDPQWALRDPGTLGLGCDGGIVEFQSVQILEFSGKGTRVRP
jgi:tRNA A-37 threonylcarbamoyl transferase component Bud32